MKINPADKQSVSAACSRLNCTRDELMLAINVVGTDIEAVARRLSAEPSTRSLWEDPAPDLLQDGQEEVFSHRAVELGLDHDPLAILPAGDD